jgi:hypothetical protein
MSWKYRDDGMTVLNSGGVSQLQKINFGVQKLTEATTLTADDNGKTFLLALAGGFTVTLPANSVAGFRCRFMVKIAPTTAYIIAAATADSIYGRAHASSGGDEDSDAAGDTVEFVANTSLIGDYVDIFIDGEKVFAYGFCDVTGSITISG